MLSSLYHIKNQLTLIDQNLNNFTNNKKIGFVIVKLRNTNSIQTKIYSSKWKGRWAYFTNYVSRKFKRKNNDSILGGIKGKEQLYSQLIRDLTVSAMQFDDLNRFQFDSKTFENSQAVQAEITKQIQEINTKINQISNHNIFDPDQQKILANTQQTLNRIWNSTKLNSTLFKNLENEIDHLPVLTSKSLPMLNANTMNEVLKQRIKQFTENSKKIEVSPLTTVAKKELLQRLLDRQKIQNKNLIDFFEELYNVEKVKIQSFDYEKSQLYVDHYENIIRTLKTFQSSPSTNPSGVSILTILLERTQSLQDLFVQRKNHLDDLESWKTLLKAEQIKQTTRVLTSYQEGEKYKLELQSYIATLQSKEGFEKVSEGLVDIISLIDGQIYPLLKQEITDLLTEIQPTAMAPITRINQFKGNELETTLLKLRNIDEKIKQAKAYNSSDLELLKLEGTLQQHQTQFMKKYETMFDTVTSKMSKIQTSAEYRSLKEKYHQHSVRPLAELRALIDSTEVQDAIKQMEIFATFLPNLLHHFEQLTQSFDEMIQKKDAEVLAKQKLLSELLTRPKYSAIIENLRKHHGKTKEIPNVHEIGNLDQTIALIATYKNERWIAKGSHRLTEMRSMVGNKMKNGLNQLFGKKTATVDSNPITISPSLEKIKKGDVVEAATGLAVIDDLLSELNQIKTSQISESGILPQVGFYISVASDFLKQTVKQMSTTTTGPEEGFVSLLSSLKAPPSSNEDLEVVHRIGVKKVRKSKKKTKIKKTI